jgi:hypothetical protein
MKTNLILLCVCLLSWKTAHTQSTDGRENFGHTLNVTGGSSYYRYVGYAVAVGSIDYEFQIDRNLTLAPFLAMYSYSGSHYWSADKSHYQYYSYQETVVPFGCKVTYYFDELLHASSRWDFYAGGSLGIIYRRTVWPSTYAGDKQIYPGTGPMYMNLHVGTEFHVSSHFGLVLDLSTGMSTAGIAWHLPNHKNQPNNSTL